MARRARLTQISAAVIGSWALCAAALLAQAPAASTFVFTAPAGFDVSKPGTKAGRVERGTADHDKRQSVLQLSDAGWAIYDQVAPRALEHERRLLAHLDADEQQWLARILDKLWEAELEESGSPPASARAILSSLGC